MSYIKEGRRLMAFADGKAIALATNHSLTITPSILEDRTKDDGDEPVADFDTYTWGISTDSVVGSNEIDAEYSIVALIDKMLAKVPLEVAFDITYIPTGSVPNTGWDRNDGVEYPFTTGSAWIESLSITAGASGYATASVSFKGKGKLS